MVAPMLMGPAISGLDKGLAIAAAVLGLAFLVHIVLITLGVHVD
jgi:hypothetical protein